MRIKTKDRRELGRKTRLEGELKSEHSNTTGHIEGRGVRGGIRQVLVDEGNKPNDIQTDVESDKVCVHKDKI